MRQFFIASLITLLLATGVATADRDTPPVRQLAWLTPLMNGAYDGQLSMADYVSKSTIGLGTFHQLAGELIILDGTLYQAAVDGTIHTPDTDITTPFAVMTDLEAGKSIDLPPQESLADLISTLESTFDNQTAIYSFKLSGTFTQLTVRSVPTQIPPYKPLVEVVKDQNILVHRHIPGTLVGFKFPALYQGLNVPGYHLHFISADKRWGGHVLGLDSQTLSGLYQATHRFEMTLPDNLPEAVIKPSADLNQAVQQVEQSEH